MPFSLFPKLIKKRFNPLIMIVISFLFLILFGSFLLHLPFASKHRNWTPFLDAAFTATSATTVTGLVVLDTGDHWSFFGQLIILFLIHIGGLGYMTIIASMILLVKKRDIRDALILGETLNTYSFREMFLLAKSLFMVVILLEVLGALTLFISWVPSMGIAKALWYWIFHAIAAFNNAGFDLMGNYASMTQYVGDPVVNIVIMGLIIAGGLGFFVFLELFHWIRGQGRLMLHTKVVLTMTSFLIITGAGLIFVFEYNNPYTLARLPLEAQIWSVLFTSVTARTAGFNTLPIEKMTDPSLFLLIILMFVGASPGGTGGGVKTTTIAVVFFTLWGYIRGNSHTDIGTRRVEETIVRKAYAIIVLAMCFIILFTFGLLLRDHYRFLQVGFETVSAFGTVGLSTGMTPHLSSLSKGILMAAMFVGRIGSLSIILLFTTQRGSRVFRPTEHLSIG